MQCFRIPKHCSGSHIPCDVAKDLNTEAIEEALVVEFVANKFCTQSHLLLLIVGSWLFVTYPNGKCPFLVHSMVCVVCKAHSSGA